jgi:hypothetical protein
LTVLAMLALLLAGCVAGGGTNVIPRTADGPAMKLAMGLYERSNSLQTLAARGGAMYSEGNQRNYVKFEMVMKKPKFRFTAFDPAGRPAFRLAFDGAEIYGIMFGSREYIAGYGPVETLGRFLPLDIAPEQLLGMMSGSLWLYPPVAAGAGEFDGRATELLVALSDMDSEDELSRVKILGNIDQNPQNAVLESAAYGPARKPLGTVRYNAVKSVPREDLSGLAEPFPHSIEARWDDREQKSLRVTYNEVRLGLSVADDLFKLERPEGFELIQLQ